MAWISADEGDDVQRLLGMHAGGAGAFRSAVAYRAGVAGVARVGRASVEAQRRPVAAEIINALDACDAARTGIIVFEDVHRVMTPRILSLPRSADRAA